MIKEGKHPCVYQSVTGVLLPMVITLRKEYGYGHNEKSMPMVITLRKEYFYSYS